MKQIRDVTILVVLTIVTGFLAYFCLSYYTDGFIKTNFFWLFPLSLVVLALALGGGIAFSFLGRKKPLFISLLRTLFSGYALAIILLFVLFLMQKTGFIELISDADRYTEYLQTSGRWMPFVYILLQYLQVVILPIPSFISTVAGVALFGPFFAMLYSIVGIFLGSLTAFFIGRKFGYKAVAWIVGEDTLQKWQGKVKGKDNLLLTAMFLLPIFPDDVLCFIAGLSSMPSLYFVVMVFISRVWGAFSTCYSIGYIPFTEWWGILLWVLIGIVVVTLFLLLYKNVDKLNAWIERTFRKKR